MVFAIHCSKIKNNIENGFKAMGQLEDMQVFVRVVDAGGIGLAAEQMGIAKSAVSRRLAELENRLGVSLITRTTRSSKLTEAGENYYARSQQLINDIDELNNLTTDPSCSLNGNLRLSVPLTFGLLHLTAAIEQFIQEHPELNLDINFNDSETDLIEEGFDLAFRIGDLKGSSLKARKISPIKLNICASPDYLKKYGIPKKPKDLKKHKLLKYALYHSNQWKLFDENGKIHHLPLHSAITANNGDFLNAMAISGHGIVIQPTFITWQAIAQKQLVPILSDYSLPEINAYAVYPNTRFTSRKVRLFIDFLCERFGNNPYWDQTYD